MVHGGHGMAIASIGALLLSTAFLIWVAEKTGNTYQKLGKIVGAVALALSSLLVIASVGTCVYRAVSDRDAGKGCPMMQMMEEGRGMGMPGMEMGPGMGRGPGMHRGMMGQGMGPMMAPPEAPEAPEPPAAPEHPKDAKGH
jgi:hypothetical protein